jgi:UPF0755 protein
MTPRFGGRKDGGDDEGSAAQRSAAEREVARLERERRRAEREGRSLPPEPAPPAAEPAAAEPVLEMPFESAGEPAPAAPEPEPVYEVPFEPVAEPAAEPEHVWDPEPVTVPLVDELDTGLHPQVEQPAGVRRVPAPSVSDLPQVGGARPVPPGPVRGPAGRRQRRPPKPPKGRGVPRSRRGARRLFPLVLLLIVVAIGYVAYRIFQPGHDAGDAQRPIVVTIPRGATAGEISSELEHQGVIDSSFFFNLRSRLSGRRADLKAGRFTLKRDMSYAAALDALTQNPAAAPTVSLTIPEGRSISEAAALVRRSALTGSYLKAASRNPRTVKGLRAYGVPRGTKTLEGFLFPATYELRRGKQTATASALVTQQLATFRKTYNPLDRRAARRKNLTDYDVLIIASMIEREAEVAKDRKLISAVIYNRLKDRIPLGIDATLRYRLDNWTRPLKQSELQTDSAFNTRTRRGLPPTPIGSPGLASIQAALAPAKVSYLYYVVKPCGDGAHAFSSTDAQFQRDVAAYNKKRAQLGGKDPSHC